MIETLIGIAVFALIAVSVYQVYTSVMNVTRNSNLKIAAAGLANEQFEIIRNLSYVDVGVVGGIPNGKIPHIQNLMRGNTEFTVKATIRNIDDPFDGTIGGSPNDLSPADYKLVELEISCASCKNFAGISFTAQISPESLETTSTNGALFVHVFDAAGQPISEAEISIKNNQTFPSIAINETTNNNGLLQIVDAPPGIEAYEIFASKPGYSSEQTRKIGAPENPNPVKPHSTVAVGQLTEISFAIDHVSSVEVSTVTDVCEAMPSVDFSLSGSKLIGTAPDILKYSGSYITDESGKKSITELEWDTYNLNFTDSDYDLVGTSPLIPFILNPNTSQNLQLTVALKNPLSLLVGVKDASSQLPLSDAQVILQGVNSDETLFSGRGFSRQSDWSGGAGQEDFNDPVRYFVSDGNIDIGNPAGEIRLNNNFGVYSASGYLISSTFDTGSASNFHQILWQSQSQPPATGPDSVRFQIASNNDKESWNFLGPDGTENTYYTLANQNINAVHNGSRYLRYKVFLQTSDSTWTPSLSDISFTFTSLCVPPGQVFFSGLESGDYDLTVSKSGYQTFSEIVSIVNPWQRRDIVLSP